MVLLADALYPEGFEELRQTLSVCCRLKIFYRITMSRSKEIT